MTVVIAPRSASGGLDPGDVVRQRLTQIAPPLLGEQAAAAGETADLLDTLVGSVLADPQPDRVWLLLVGLSGCFPDDALMRRALRTLEISDRVGATLWLLDTAMTLATEAGTVDWPMAVVTDGVVLDVTHSAEHDLHTGIQRVVRSTLPIWARSHTFETCAVVEGGFAMRRLHEREADRVLRWADTHADAADQHTSGLRQLEPDPLADVLVVPWRSTVVLMEVPSRDTCDRLAALGEWSGNRLVAVGYDAIPIVSSLIVPLAEPNRFVHYLTAIKHTDVVAGISVSATQEFRGFANMLPSQGITGPRVIECALPVDDGGRPEPGTPAALHHDDPLVVCVGSFEPRKNQQAVLYAAEVLWREGLRFRLRFIGGSAWGNTVAREVARLARRGRAVEMRTAVSDDELEASYREARFTVFVSRHEGYGLPLAESLARGVPAVTSDFGSQREIAHDGGALTVDPRDDDALVDAMRSLLVDDTLLEDLRRQIAARPRRTWSDYADELWSVLGLPAEV
ncbi:glycosyltransferase [Jatrophihabitans sp. YIM 134969]